MTRTATDVWGKQAIIIDMSDSRGPWTHEGDLVASILSLVTKNHAVNFGRGGVAAGVPNALEPSH